MLKLLHRIQKYDNSKVVLYKYLIKIQKNNSIKDKSNVEKTTNKIVKINDNVYKTTRGRKLCSQI